MFSIDVQPGSTVAGSFSNLGTLAVLAADEMAITTGVGASFTSSGTVQVAIGGTLTVDSGLLGGAIVNNGVILAVGDGPPGQTDTLEVSGALTGTGTLDIGTNGILKSDAVPSEAIAFPTTGAGILILPGPGPFTAPFYTMPLMNLNTGDKIAFTGGSPITGVSTSDNSITITTTTTTINLSDVSFAPGADRSFSWFQDSATGDWTIQEVQPGDIFTGSVSTDLGSAGNWTFVGVPTAADALYFNTGGDLTGAAVGLTANFNGSGGWVLNGATLTLAGNPNPPYDAYALNFDTNVVLNGATLAASGTASFASSVTVTAQGGSSVTDAGDTLGQNADQFAALILSGGGTNWTESANPALDGNGQVSGYLNVGFSGVGLLNVTGGASLNTGSYTNVGAEAGSSGEATIASGGQWTAAGLLVGLNAGSEGQVIVAGGTVSDSQNLQIGQNGDGQATITAGGTLVFSGTFAAVGNDAGSSGQLVIDAGGTLLATGTPSATDYDFDIGDDGPSGTLAAADGSVIVTGVGALLNMGGNPLAIGLAGNGELTVANGATVLAGTPNSNNVDAISIGRQGNGLVEVTGAGSALLTQGQVYAARGGTGQLVVSDGGFLDVGNDPMGVGGLEIGEGSGSPTVPTGGTGDATVTSGDHVLSQSGMDVGGDGVDGTLNVNDGGSIEVDTRVGVGVGGTVGTLTAGGAGVVNIGAGGTLQIDGTGLAAGNAALYLGDYAGTVGQVNVSGAGASLDVLGTNHITLGTASSTVANTPSGSGDMSVSQGAVATANQIIIGLTGEGSFSVNTGGSVEVNSLRVAGGQVVGTVAEAGQGTLNIDAGSTVTVDGVGLTTSAVAVGYYGGAVGQVDVTGTGALLNVLGPSPITLGTYNSAVTNSTSGNGSMTVSQGAVANANEIRVGYTGSGALNVSNAGTVQVGETLSVGDGLLVGTIQEAGFGVINIGAAGTINVAGTGLAAGVAALTAGSYVGSTGIVDVSGSNALLNLGTHDLRLGTNSGNPASSGSGSLTTSFGGLVEAGTIVVGDTGIGNFTADIGGAYATVVDVGAQGGGQGNVFLTSGDTGLGLNSLIIGDQGVGRVAATSGAALVVHGTAIIGNTATGNGQLAVSGGAHFVAQALIDGDAGTGALTVGTSGTGEIITSAAVGSGVAGQAGSGALNVGVGGTVTVDGTGLAAGVAALTAGSFANATGIVTVSGSGAVLNVGTRDIRLGTNSGNPASSGDGILAVSLGGLVTAGTIVVGDTGIGSFTADIGGAYATAIDVGAQAGGQGTVLLTGGDTGLGLNALTVGDQGLGRVTVTNNAALVVHGTAILGKVGGATGQVAVASGAHFNAQTLIDGASGIGALSIDTSGEVTVNNGITIGTTGALTLQGGDVTAAQIVSQSDITGSGVITAPLVNNGVVTASAGPLTISGAISGTGVLAMAGNSELVVGTVGAGQEFAFTAPGGVLQLGSLAATGAGVIAGFGAGDQIQVVAGSSISTSFNAASDALTITTGATSQTFQMTGTHAAADFTSSVVGVDTVTAANQTINLGTGPHFLYLGGASTNDTIVAPSLPSLGTSNLLDIFGFTATDTLDFSTALAGTTWNGNAGTLGSYLQIASSGSADVVSISQTGSGAGTPALRLENTNLTFNQLVAHSIT